MAARTTLNAKNLEALGAPRLAELLLEISAGDTGAKRRLRLALAGSQGPVEVAREVRKRLATIARATAYVDWKGARALADDLDTQLRAITEQIAPADPAEALDLLWRFIDLADSVYSRCDDSGSIGDTFAEACSELGRAAFAALPAPRALADRAFEALTGKDYGQYDDLIPTLAPALGPEGLEHLKQRMIALSNEPVWRPPEEVAERSRVDTVRRALTAIADAEGDVDAFIGQHDERVRKVPRIAADIARRLLAAGRPEEAWQTLETAEHPPRASSWPDFEWEDARIDVLDALGRPDEAQAARWSCFERSLSADHLRAYLKRLPDFDDMEAEERALELAEHSGSLLQALAFLSTWQAFDRAAALVVARFAELDGDHYEILAPLAKALADRHPLAATLLLRALIDFSLEASRTSRYRHAARNLEECARLAASTDFAGLETHDAYLARLRADHGRKRSFWELVG